MREEEGFLKEHLTSSDHLKMVESIFNEIANNFSIKEQNEILHSVKCKIADRRSEEISSLEKRIEEIQESLKEL